ncbi:MAG: hypothetical protein ACKPKR_08935 [Microcystis panniformis]
MQKSKRRINNQFLITGFSISYQLSVISYQLSVIRCKFSDVSFQM